MRLKPYLSLMGSLLWATLTHPECAYYVAFLCQFMHDPSIEAWEAALGILCYLQNAKTIGITFDKNKRNILAPFTDSSGVNHPCHSAGSLFSSVGELSPGARENSRLHHNHQPKPKAQSTQPVPKTSSSSSISSKTSASLSSTPSPDLLRQHYSRLSHRQRWSHKPHQALRALDAHR